MLWFTDYDSPFTSYYWLTFSCQQGLYTANMKTYYNIVPSMYLQTFLYFLCLVQVEINYSVVPFSMQLLEDKGSWSRIWPVITSHQCLKLGQIWWSIVMSWSYRVKISTELNLDKNGEIVEFKFLRISIFFTSCISYLFIFKDCQFQ